jgi:predicted nucleotidyltransferase
LQVARAEAINADPDLAHVVTELRLYGSVLNETAGEVGDVDIAFALNDRPGIDSRVAAS